MSQGFKLYKNKAIIEFIKFGIVGVSNTVISLLIYYILVYFKFHYLSANISAWIISVYNAFYWNQRYVFKSDNKWYISLLKTYLTYGLTFLFGTFLLFILIEVFNFSEYLAPLYVLMFTVPLNFFINKFWTFKKRISK